MGNTVGFYALNGPDDLWQLKEKSDQIEKDLLNDDNISQLEVIGYSPIIISVELDENELLRHNLNFDIISNQKLKCQILIFLEELSKLKKMKL